MRMKILHLTRAAELIEQEGEILFVDLAETPGPSGPVAGTRGRFVDLRRRRVPVDPGPEQGGDL